MTPIALSLLFAACAKSVAPEAVPTETEPTPPDPPTLVLDGVATPVYWDDGDTFRTTPEGDEEVMKARMAGYNTLESYGPVHRWGDFTAAELYDTATSATDMANSQIWICTVEPGGGGYGRALVNCGALRHALLSAGLAHVFALDESPPEADLAAQAQAIEAGVGMWAKGAPAWLTTSLHSEDESNRPAYNRACSTTTGLCEKRDHSDTYTTCNEVCVEDSCMIYVPYQERYGAERAACLGGDPAPDGP